MFSVNILNLIILDVKLAFSLIKKEHDLNVGLAQRQKNILPKVLTHTYESLKQVF